MMDKISLVFICILLLNMAIVFSRLPIKKNPLFFLLSIQLFGTNGIAILLLASEFSGLHTNIDLALASTLLTGVASLVFVKSYQKGKTE